MRKASSVKTTLLSVAILALLPPITAAWAEPVFLRVRVVQPAGQPFKVNVGGRRHAGEPWSFPNESVKVSANSWSEWLNLSRWPWHGRANRSGGFAEWPSIRLSLEGGEVNSGCAMEVQLADRPDPAAAVISFTERSESREIGFLVPTPLREKKGEFETGSQMAARHLAWATEATGGKPIELKRLGICTSLGGQYDPAMARQGLQTLKQLGFNIINADSGMDAELVRGAGFRLYQQVWIYEVHPERDDRLWNEFVEHRLKKSLESEIGRWEFRDGVAHWVLKDEISSHARFYKGDPYDGWFRQYLRERGVTDESLGQRIDEVVYPTDSMQKTAIPHEEVDLKTRKQLYYASKFAHWLSTRSLRHTTDLIHQTLPASQTETLPTSHGFWGHGMDRQHLDFFEIGRQRAVDQLSAEDWLGLNHMYGPDATYTGAQTLAYLCAVMRSGIQDHNMLLRTLITPSDDGYLRLKGYSALGQGCKSFFFWAYGPTYAATENYWSDLRSMYDGIAKLNRAMSAAEDVLAEAVPVRDPVAVLYSVSNDIWGAEEIAEGRVEKRLLWHGLRHLSVQPDFLDEDQVAASRLKNYKVLYVTDWCIRRDVTAVIDQWVRDGGILYLSGGAATRDEFYQPYLPPFAQAVWPPDVTKRLVNKKGPYNERYDLPKAEAITSVKVQLKSEQFELPVLGCRVPMREDLQRWASFADGTPAGAVVTYGKGQIIALGFMPMLAYGKLASFKPTTLEEKWPAGPREIIGMPLEAAKVKPVAAANVPVVETSLLTGPKGSVLVLANYTYQPIDSLAVDVTLSGPVSKAVSTEGVTLRMTQTVNGVRLELPLKWTEMVVLHP